MLEKPFTLRRGIEGRYARIVATLGPASQDEDTIRRLLQAGVDVARLNFSHGTHSDHLHTIQLLRSVAASLGRPITILQDLQGPKIRVGQLANGEESLAPGQKVTFTTRLNPVDPKLFPVDFAGLPDAVHPGGRILIDDGTIELRVVAATHEQVETEVVVGGVLKPHKGLNLPGAKLDIPALTVKDLDDLAFGLQAGIDAVAISFVRSPEDVQLARQAVSQLAPEIAHVPIIAKLEKPEALDHLEQIVIAADGVMVARGDLGVEMSPEEVPIAQKTIISYANRYARMVITATQMLDSMIENPSPTRAEASDVANAIFDGSDALMLSGETAAGKYPVESVKVMDAIIRQAEAHLGEWSKWTDVTDIVGINDETCYISRAARELARDSRVAAIAVFTVSGRTALVVSKYRPEVPILAFTPSPATYNRLNLYWGVIPHLVEHVTTIKAMLDQVDPAMLHYGRVIPGEQVVLICGFPVEEAHPTNLILLHTVGS